MRGADYRQIRESYELRCLMEERALQLAAPFSRELIEQLAHRTREMSLAAALLIRCIRRGVEESPAPMPARPTSRLRRREREIS